VRGAGAALAGVVAAMIAATPAYAPAQTPPPKPDAMARAYLFGAAFKGADLSHKAGGMMFLPGRGLIRWETRGKTLAEQEELKTEAIGLADARAVQAEIDARQAVVERQRGGAAESMASREGLGLVGDARAPGPLNLAPVTGTRRQAGGVLALNRAAGNSGSAVPGVRNGSSFGGRGRLYMFGAVSGRAVGLNLMHDSGAGWKNAGLSSDNGGFVGQRQAGLALRRGPTQAALSLVQEKTHAQLVGMTSVKDHRAMLNFSFIPGLKR